MKMFSEISRQAQYLLTGCMFLAFVSRLSLSIYQFIRHRNRIRRLVDGVLLAVLLFLCVYLHTASFQEVPGSFPWLMVLLFAISVFLYTGIDLRRGYQRDLETLSSASVKQALDNLNAGLLFADETGKVVLVNHTMGRLVSMLIGEYPQMLYDLSMALERVEKIDKVTSIKDMYELYRFPDGKVWSFLTVPLTDPALSGFTQTTAQDMTELYESNVQLNEENTELRAAIQKTQEMAAQLTDLIPGQEALNLKIRIHNDIGTSLITLTDLIERGNRKGAEEQLEMLDRVLIPFGSSYPITSGFFETVRKQAVEMNVDLRFEGIFPSNLQIEQLIAVAAQESVTNCVRHAKGRTVRVVITERNGLYIVCITNDGKPPEHPIVEGGGLSALRKRVEDAGGELYFSYFPRFAMILNLSERRLTE